eukprot:11795890-Ditylum_brightwellii.AAC.1
METIAQVIKGNDIQGKDATYLLVKSLLKGDALQVFQNEEASQDVKDSLAFTKCLMAVTKHIFPKKAYKRQKNAVPSTGRSDHHKDFSQGVHQYSGGWNPIPVETGVQEGRVQLKLLYA